MTLSELLYDGYHAISQDELLSESAVPKARGLVEFGLYFLQSNGGRSYQQLRRKCGGSAGFRAGYVTLYAIGRGIRRDWDMELIAQRLRENGSRGMLKFGESDRGSFEIDDSTGEVFVLPQSSIELSIRDSLRRRRKIADTFSDFLEGWQIDVSLLDSVSEHPVARSIEMHEPLASLRAKMDANPIVGRQEQTELVFAAILALNVPALRMLIANRYPVADVFSSFGYPPLYSAGVAGALDVARLLLQHGAGVNMRDGRTIREVLPHGTDDRILQLLA